MARGTKRKKRTMFTMEKKLEIIREVESRRMTQMYAAKVYNTNRRSIQYWIKSKARIQKAVEEGKALKKSIYQDPLSRIRADLRKFFDIMSRCPASKRIPITRSTIAARALQCKKELLDNQRDVLSEDEVVALEAFTASDSWCGQFARDLGYVSVTLHGQAGSAPVDDPETIKAMKELRETISHFPSSHVYNVDETGLYYKLLPNKSYVKKVEKHLYKGTKAMAAKERVTLTVCTNADGSHIFPLSIIGRAHMPVCFRNKNVPMTYFQQENAWSCAKVFQKWYDWFVRVVKQRTADKVLLVVDNCVAHLDDTFVADPQIEIACLPPNCTSVYQPMDMGVISALKRNYRMSLLGRVLENFEQQDELRKKAAKMTRGSQGLAQGHPPHLMDAMKLLIPIWKEMSVTSVQKYWDKSTLLNYNPSPQEQQQAEQQEQQEQQEQATRFNELVSTMRSLGPQLAATEYDGTQRRTNDLDEQLVGIGEEVAAEDGDVAQMLEQWLEVEEDPLVCEMEMQELAEIAHPANLLEETTPDIGVDGESDDEDVELDPVDMSSDDYGELSELLHKVATMCIDHAGPYTEVATMVSDANYALRRSFKEQEQKRKASKTLRQPSVAAYFTKK